MSHSPASVLLGGMAGWRPAANDLGPIYRMDNPLPREQRLEHVKPLSRSRPGSS